MEVTWPVSLNHHIATDPDQLPDPNTVVAVWLCVNCWHVLPNDIGTGAEEDWPLCRYCTDDLYPLTPAVAAIGDVQPPELGDVGWRLLPREGQRTFWEFGIGEDETPWNAFIRHYHDQAEIAPGRAKLNLPPSTGQ